MKLDSSPNLLDIYVALITDKVWIMLFVFGCLLFLSIQIIGQGLHSKLLSKSRQKCISDKLFGGQCQSLFHSIMVSIPSIALLIKYEFENISQANDLLIDVGKIVSVFSMSYFFVMTIYDGFIIQGCAHYERIILCIHHILSMLTTAFASLNPFGLLLWASIIQVEISTIFLNMREFAKNFGHRSAFSVGSIGIFITYPLTRIVILSHTIYLTRLHQIKLKEIIGQNAWYLVLCCEEFVVLMSIAYFAKIVFSASHFLRFEEDEKTKNDYDIVRSRNSLSENQGQV